MQLLPDCDSSDFIGVAVGDFIQETYGSALGFLELLIGVRCSAIHAPILDWSHESGVLCFVWYL